MMIKIILIFVFVLCQILQTQTISYNQEFLVNNYTTGCQILPSISKLSGGGFVVCWISDDDNGGHSGIFGQLFKNDGSKNGAEFQINTETENKKSNPCVSSFLDGRFIVCWESESQDGSENGIYGQIFEYTGTKYGQEFQVNTYAESNQQYPCVSSLPDGKFVFCWESESQDGSETGIYGQLFNIDGSRYGEEFRANTRTDELQSTPSVTSLSDGKFVICWFGGIDTAGEGFEIYGQIFNNDGSRYNEEFRVNTYTYDWQIRPSVSNLTSGKFVVCWQTMGYYSDKGGIYGQIFKSDGSKSGKEFRVNTYPPSVQQWAKVTGLVNDRFVICWISFNQDGDDFGIFGQIFENDGLKYGIEFQVNSTTAAIQSTPTLSSLDDGKFVICWTNINEEFNDCEIVGKYYLSALSHPLQPFSLVMPIYDTTLDKTSSLFKWYRAESAQINYPWEQLEYKIYLDESPEFSDPRIIPAIYDTSISIGSFTPGTTYLWKVLAKNNEGDSLWSSEVNAFFVSHEATVIEDPHWKNFSSFELYPNYPNPFNPVTTILYKIPSVGTGIQVIINIYDTLGREVKLIYRGVHNPGEYTIKWNGKNDNGLEMPSGIYYCLVQAGAFKASQKLLLVR